MLQKLYEDWKKIQKANPFNNTQTNSTSEMNIFNILGVQSREVYVCRFLGELLNPNGSHQLNALPLKLFLEEIKHPFDENLLESAEVELEDPTDANRRIDIVIYIGNETIPIEVKINAGDQNAQLKDYYDYCFKDDSSCIYYLTPTGTKPSKESQQNLRDDQIKQISFADHIQRWIDALIQISNNTRTIETLSQFKEVISEMCQKFLSESAFFDLLESDFSWQEPTDKVLFALNMLNHSKALLKKFRIAYLREALACPPEYTLCELADNERGIDNHALLKVCKGDNVIAWICVDTNIYLACEKIKENPSKCWKSGKGKWIRINPDRGNETPYNLGSPDWFNIHLPSQKYPLQKLLDDIEV